MSGPGVGWEEKESWHPDFLLGQPWQEQVLETL